jgi:hypothetical protein
MSVLTSFEDQSSVKKPQRFAWAVGAVFVLLVLLAVGTYTWYSLQRSCDVNAVKDASERLVRQRNRYDHSYQFATSVAQNAVVRPVADLQQILMDTQEVQVPGCMQTAKEELIDYMGIVIRAFLAYGAQEADTTVRDLLDQSNAHYDKFNSELKEVNQCAPFCIRWSEPSR